MSAYSITITREYASGGRLIGQKIAEQLGLKFYDREVISMVAQQKGLTEDYVESVGQRRGFFFFDTYGFTGELPMPDQIFIAESNVIKELAAGDPAVFVGRNAGFVLRDEENIINISIHAPIEWRIEHAKTAGYDLQGVVDIKAFIEKQDKTRRYYKRFFTDRNWDRPQDYHLTIDSSIGTDAAAAVIIAYVNGYIGSKD
jgi:cytidylate kinase